MKEFLPKATNEQGVSIGDQAPRNPMEFDYDVDE